MQLTNIQTNSFRWLLPCCEWTWRSGDAECFIRCVCSLFLSWTMSMNKELAKEAHCCIYSWFHLFYLRSAHSTIEVISRCKVKTENNQSTLCKYLATVGRKGKKTNSLELGENLQQNEAQWGAAICHSRLRDEGGKRWEKRRAKRAHKQDEAQTVGERRLKVTTYNSSI